VSSESLSHLLLAVLAPRQKHIKLLVDALVGAIRLGEQRVFGPDGVVEVGDRGSVSHFATLPPFSHLKDFSRLWMPL
jgi:hypothetical protein